MAVGIHRGIPVKIDHKILSAGVSIPDSLRYTVYCTTDRGQEMDVKQ